MQYACLGERALHLEYAGLNLALGRVQMMMGSVNASPVRTHGVVQSFSPSWSRPVLLSVNITMLPICNALWCSDAVNAKGPAFFHETQTMEASAI